MTSAPVVSITDELLAEIDESCQRVNGGFIIETSDAKSLLDELRRLRAEVQALTLEADYANNNYMASLMLVADIRAAAGDPNGRLMQPELVAHIAELRRLANA